MTTVGCGASILQIYMGDANDRRLDAFKEQDAVSCVRVTLRKDFSFLVCTALTYCDAFSNDLTSPCFSSRYSCSAVLILLGLPLVEAVRDLNPRIISPGIID